MGENGACLGAATHTFVRWVSFLWHASCGAFCKLPGSCKRSHELHPEMHYRRWLRQGIVFLKGVQVYIVLAVFLIK